MLFSLFLNFLIIDLSFLILAVFAQIFNLTVECAIPIGISTNKAKAEIETHPVIAETYTSNCSM